MTTVYKMMSVKTNFFYIGCTTKKLSYRMSGHKESFKKKKFKIYNKIRSIGLTIDDFIIKEIATFSDRKEGLELESLIIKEYCDNPYLLNQQGVDSPWNKGTTHEVSQETRDKISKANRGRPSWIKGKKQTKEHTANIVKALTGKKLSNSHCEAISKAQKGLSRKFNDVMCPHCGKIGKDNVMYKWHFDNCKYTSEEERLKAESPTPLDFTKIVTCPHCGKIGKYMGMNRWHFDNCREIKC